MTSGPESARGAGPGGDFSVIFSRRGWEFLAGIRVSRWAQNPGLEQADEISDVFRFNAQGIIVALL